VPYSITGHGRRSETRLQSASAIVLAMKWEAEGQRVKITDIDGREHTIGAFRMTLAKKKLERRPL
jgi:YD repeat-containing protein